MHERGEHGSRRPTAQPPLGGPVGRLVTAVVASALLPGLGVDRLVLGVSGRDGRLSIAPLGELAALSTAGRVSLGELTTVVGHLRTVAPGTPPRLEQTAVGPLITYAARAGRLGDLVAAGLCSRVPEGQELDEIHAVLGSGLRSIAEESAGGTLRPLPQVSLRTSEQGYRARILAAADGGPQAPECDGGTAAEAVARAAAARSGRSATIRFAAQKAVGDRVVSLVVADVDGIGPLLGATAMDCPSTAAPVVAVDRACLAAEEVAGEAGRPPAIGVDGLAGQFALR